MTSGGRVTRTIDAMGAWIERVRASMTPGQRWTAALALVLATLLVRFGMPADVVVPAALGASVRAPARSVVTGGASSIAPVDTLTPISGSDGGFVSALDTAGSDDAFTVDSGLPPVAPGVPNVVALVRSGGTAPGRDDAAVAAAFLAKAGFKATTIVDDPADASVCARAVAAGRLVIASTGLEPALRDCLVAGDVSILSFDDVGDVESAVSTRRGVGRALADMARGAPVGALRGRVGIVSGARLRPFVDAATDDMAAAGVDVVDVVTLADDVSNADVADAVRRFASENVEVVVFAAPVARQRQWLGPAGVLLPTARYLVADAYDAVVSDETYPPSFDGALAYTSARTPWSERTHGESAVQAGCRTQWEAAATPPKMLSGAETVDVYAWCEHVALVAQVLERIAIDDVSLAGALGDLQYEDAPLTSALRGRGPALDAVLAWSVQCSCWTEKQSFTPRA